MFQQIMHHEFAERFGRLLILAGHAFANNINVCIVGHVYIGIGSVFRLQLRKSLADHRPLFRRSLIELRQRQKLDVVHGLVLQQLLVGW
jgi:hypothetical protein